MNPKDASSIIAVTNVPPRWALMHVVKIITKIIKAKVSALNYHQYEGNRCCFLRLSPHTDVRKAIIMINECQYKAGSRFLRAVLPKNIPKLSVSHKPKESPPELCEKLKIVADLNPAQVVLLALHEILTEMRCKYWELTNLSKKTDNKLLNMIAKVIFDRIKIIATNLRKKPGDCSELTEFYRKLHPHFGDFQLILNTYQKIEPNAELNEKEMLQFSTHPYMIENVPYDKVLTICNKYADKIINRVSGHVNNLDTKINLDTDDEEVIAKKKVRQELKKINVYLPSIIRQVVTRSFIPNKSPLLRVRIYGEPTLPPKESMLSLLKPHNALRIQKSHNMHNLLLVNLAPQEYLSVMSMDGIVIGGAKLVIRPCTLKIYNMTKELRNEISQMFGESKEVLETPENNEDEEPKQIELNVKDKGEVWEWE